MLKRIVISVFSLCLVFTMTGCSLTDFVGNMGLDPEDVKPLTTLPPATTTAIAPTTTVPAQTIPEITLNEASYGEYKVTPPKKSSTAINAVRAVSSASEVFSSEDIITRDPDTSAVLAREGADIGIKNSTIVSNSPSSSSMDTRFFGMNSAVLCYPRSHISINDSEIGTTGNGSAGVFSYGSGAVVDLASAEISTYGTLSYGVATTYKGNIFGSNPTIKTTGNYSPAVLVGRNGGTINLISGEVSTTGIASPAAYSAGELALTGTKLSAQASEAVIIEGKGSAMLTGCDISSESTNTIRLFCSNSGDASPGLTTVNMFGGSVSTKTGAAFYVANTDAKIYLQKVDLKDTSGSLVTAVANDKWGEDGENGSNVRIIANYQDLKGDIYADNLSTVTVELTALSTFTGGINSTDTAKKADVILDASSRWIVTENSFVSEFTPGMADFSNIIDNGYTIYYDPAENPNFGGETITLQGGGLLAPTP